MTDAEIGQLLYGAVRSSRRRHYYCEDTWYSCPKADEGCANAEAGAACNCGAEIYNTNVDNLLRLVAEVRPGWVQA